MKRILFLISMSLICVPVFAQDDLDLSVLNYIKKYRDLAMDEQQRSGVPASITLAQGIHESASGQSRLATNANNHFGIKCKKSWKGETILHDDDRRQECFRKYKSADESYKDHSNFLKDNPRYANLFNLKKTDYIGWSMGLRKAGYATNPKYATRLIALIEKYNLQNYTQEASNTIKKEPTIAAEIIPQEDKKIVPTKSLKPSIDQSKAKKPAYELTTYKGLPGFYAQQGDYLLPYAMQYNIRLAKLFNMNDLVNDSLSSDMFIFTKKKRKTGSKKYHIVESGETMHSIAQKEAIQLKYLYIYNNLYDAEEPAVGEKLYLQEKSLKTPALRGETPSPVIVKTLKKTVSPKEITISKSDQKEVIETIQIKKEPEVTETSKPIIKEVSTPKVVKQADKNISKTQEENRWLKKRVFSKDSFKRVSSNPNILDIDKAKRIEQLLDGGKSEIGTIRLEPIYPEKQKVITKEKALDTTPSKTAVKEKISKNQVIDTIPTKKVVQEKTRTYEEKNVGDDVKDLKKKFDSIIYKNNE